MACVLILSIFPLPVNAEWSEDSEITLADLDGGRFGCLLGTISYLDVDALYDSPQSYLYFSSRADLIEGLMDGVIDAAVVDTPVAQATVKNDPSLKFVYLDEDPEGTIGFVLKKDSSLKGPMDEIIRGLKESGEMDAMYDRWTGEDQDEKVLPEISWNTDNGILRIAVSGVQEPTDYFTEGHEIAGLDVEIAYRIAEGLEMYPDVYATTFSGILAAIDTDAADIGAGCIAINAERSEEIDFTESLYPSGIGIIVVSDGDTPAAGFAENIREGFKRSFITQQRWKLLLSGLMYTLIIAVFSGIFSLITGYLLTLLRRLDIKLINLILNILGRIIEGVPAIVILMILYYVVFSAARISAVITAVIGFTLIYGIAVYETVWDAVCGINKSQRDAALALGYTEWETFNKIILPQASKRFIPALEGLILVLVKDTSIAGYISVIELTMAGEIIRGNTMDAFFVLITISIIYFLIIRSGYKLMEYIRGKAGMRRSREVRS